MVRAALFCVYTLAFSLHYTSWSMIGYVLFVAVFGSSWFDHIKTWYSHKDDVNMLFITYEEMIQV